MIEYLLIIYGIGFVVSGIIIAVDELANTEYWREGRGVQPSTEDNIELIVMSTLRIAAFAVIWPITAVGLAILGVLDHRRGRR